MTKQQQVLEYLLQGNTITLKESVAMFKLYALSQTLGFMRRQKGIPIQSRLEIAPNGERYSRYWLDKDFITWYETSRQKNTPNELGAKQGKI